MVLIIWCSYSSQLIKETGYEAQKNPLFYVFISLDCALTTVVSEFCMSY